MKKCFTRMLVAAVLVGGVVFATGVTAYASVEVEVVQVVEDVGVVGIVPAGKMPPPPIVIPK